MGKVSKQVPADGCTAGQWEESLRQQDGWAGDMQDFGVEPICFDADGNFPALRALSWPLACPSGEGVSMPSYSCLCFAMVSRR